MDDRLSRPIEELDLSVRAYNCLRRNGLLTIGRLLPLGEPEFLALPNLGRRQYEEIMEKLAQRGFGGPMSGHGSGPDAPRGPDAPDTSGDRFPRRPSPGGRTGAAEAGPEPAFTRVDALSAHAAQRSEPKR